MTRYEATWPSLDGHPVPEWYHDAKFGLFVHYSPTWYGEDGSLPEPSAFDPEEWAGLADQAGARYLVFTTKHHDGFCNWPSDLTDFAADAVGGPRDVLTPLVDSVRRRGLRVGFYYSLLDRHHPDYPDHAEYVREYMHEQVKELVRRYEPSLLWGDGEWEYLSEHWDAQELISWYYNWAADRENDVLVNDRFGMDTRYVRTVDWDEADQRAYAAHRGLDPDETIEALSRHDPHGDYWTPEHQIVSETLAQKWETCETMHNEWSWVNAPNWRDATDLVHLLVDVVSKNGNLLLNVGPKPDSSIADHDRRLLKSIGDWLRVNGEAIYGTRPVEPGADRAPYVPHVEWWDDDRDYAQIWDDLVDEIRADGPIRLTQTGNTVYVLYLGWPGDSLRVDDLTVRSGGAIEMLGVDSELDWEYDGDALVVRTPDERPCDHAYAVRVPVPIG
jgi:alpha-L-fucosidase